jgi:hypothetical protein
MSSKYNQAFPYTLNPEQIPSKKVLDITPCCGSEVTVRYACPDKCWQEHHKAWCKQMRDGNKSAPQPMPWGHCMFDDPIGYGCIPFGCTDQTVIREAWVNHVRGNLVGGGWCRDLSEEQIEKIVNATVEAKMQGVSTGGAEYMACIYMGMEN